MAVSDPTMGRRGPLCALLAMLALVGAPTASAAAPGAYTGPDDPGLPALISSLRLCLSGLPVSDRRVLALRAGLGGRAPQLTAQVAATLNIAPAAAATAEVGAVRKLETARRSGACQARPVTRTARPAPAPVRRAAASGGSGDSTTSVLEVVVPGLLVLAFLAGISLEMTRRPQRR